jgi:cytidylate kinase
MTAAISVITVAREYGSGGAAIATRLAGLLGFRLLDRALLDRVGAAARCDPAVAEKLDERVDPWLRRLVRSWSHGAFEGVASVPDAEMPDADQMAALTQSVVEEAASIGSCVIVGRGGQCILAGRPDALHVFVYAPRAERARRLRERLGPAADVEAAIDATDRGRSAYLRRHFGRDWIDRDLYHLMVNSAPGEEAAVTAILGVVSALRGRS